MLNSMTETTPRRRVRPLPIVIGAVLVLLGLFMFGTYDGSGTIWQALIGVLALIVGAVMLVALLIMWAVRRS